MTMDMDMDMGGMNMNMDNSTSTMNMMTAFSTGLGTANLWFNSWTPGTWGATLGASVGLFFLAVLSRLLSAFSTTAEASWAQSIALRRSAARLGLNGLNQIDPKLDAESPSILSPIISNNNTIITPPSSSPFGLIRRQTPPFIWAIDGPRSILFLLQAFIGYLLMLAVMTYNVWFFVAVLLGMTVGELGFGRFSVGGSGHSSGLHA